MKTQLSNGCSISELSVTPKNWNTKAAKTNNDWFVSYRFYDPHYSKPKQVILRGMNYFKSLDERQKETIKIIEQENAKLKVGFNPFIKDNHTCIVQDKFTLSSAIQFAFENVSVSERTKRDLKYVVSQCQRAIAQNQWMQLSIEGISKKHIKQLLEDISNTSDRFNKNRSYIMILLGELCEREIILTNFAKDIKKKKCLKRSRIVLSGEQRILVDNYLKSEHKEFHRFLQIFFHSGARISELLRMKVYDVDLINQRFKIVIQKGTQYREVWKTIKDIALPYWSELLLNSQENDVLFSKGLMPGKTFIKPYQIGKRWYRLVKKKLGIVADFYSLKHLHTTEVSEYLGAYEAAKHNSHTSLTMVKQVYDVKRNEREQDLIKGLSNSFS